jgi:hypothetical protein
MDLPPGNSFCRMLTHKLADYYHMTHSYEPVPGVVRIYRTPFCRIPPSLSSVAVPVQSDPSRPPPRKIMRRGEDGELAPMSAGQSKPTSEVGSDSKDKSGTKEKYVTQGTALLFILKSGLLTMIMKAHQRRARGGIYSCQRTHFWKCGQDRDVYCRYVEPCCNSAPSVYRVLISDVEGDDGNDVSRASSVSAKDKVSAGNKKPLKKRRDDSEGFETRSQYMPVVINGPQPTWAPSTPQYYHVGNPPQFSAQFQQPPYQTAAQPMYGPQAYPQMVPSNPRYHAQYSNGISSVSISLDALFRLVPSWLYVLTKPAVSTTTCSSTVRTPTNSPANTGATAAAAATTAAVPALYATNGCSVSRPRPRSCRQCTSARMATASLWTKPASNWPGTRCLVVGNSLPVWTTACKCESQ